MSSDPVIYHFTEDQRSHPVRFRPEAVYDGCNAYGVFIHRDRVYGTSAVSYGQVSSSSKNEMHSRNTLRMIEIFGKLCEQATRSPFGRARAGPDGSYTRYEAFVREIPYKDGGLSPDGKPYIGWIVWMRYTYTGDATENEDLDLEKISDMRRMKERNFVRNPVWALSRALHESAGGRSDPVSGKSFQAMPHTLKLPPTTTHRRWVDSMTKAQLYDELMFYAGDFDYTYANSCELHAVSNPANPYNAMSISKACQLAEAAGADVDYLKVFDYMGMTEFPDKGERMWRIRINECVPNRLLQTFFPDQKKPEWEVDAEGLDYMRERYYDADLAEEKGEGFAKMHAKQSVRLNVQRSMLSCAQSQSIEGIRARMDKMYERELNQQADISFEEQAAIKLDIQRRGCEHKRTVLHPDGNLPNALKALCKALQETLEVTPNRNFCMPLPRQTKNLSCLGENIAYMMLSLEKIFGVHSLHRECLLARLAILHICSVGSFHPHPMFLGDPMVGKSMIIKFLQMTLAPGTWKSCDHMSSQAFMSKENADIHFMRLLSEEFEPSAVGYNPSSSGDREGRASSGRDMALTDKASAIRALMTSMEMSFSRLVQRTDNGAYERESAAVKTNVVFCGAMNATASDLAANSRSRWLLVNIQNRPRDTASVQGKIVGTTGFTKTPEFAKFRQRMIRDEVVVGHVFLMIYTRILDDINRAVTDAIFVDVLQQCSKAGLGGANDIRNFEKTRMLTDVICVLRATWEYFDSGLPGMKNPKEAFKEDDFLALGKLLETSVEDLVLAVTLTGDQYEDPVMWGAVEAMNRLFTTGYAQNPHASDSQLMANYKADDAKARDAAENTERKKGKKKKTNSTPAPSAPQEEDKKGELGVSWRDGRVFDGDGKETAQSTMRTQMRRQQEQNYTSVEWIDRSPYMTDPQRCNLLAERIRPLMPSKHSLAAVQSFLRNLYHETVDDVNRPGQSIPVIAWPDSGSQDGKTRTCLIAKSILSNNKQDRLVSILSNILDKQGMPDIEYITGVPEMRTPFVLLTVVPDHVKRLRAEVAGPSDFSSFLVADGKDEKKSEKKAAPKRGRYMIRDPGWVDQGVTLFVRRAITFDMDEDQRDAVLRKSATDLFRQPWVEIDCDIEEYGTYRGMSNSLTAFETLEQLGFGNVKDATRVLIRKTRSEAYHAIPTFFVLLQYPDCFHSRDPDYLHKERWRTKRRRSDSDDKEEDGKRMRRDVSEDSLDAMRNARVPTNLGMEISRFRGTVDPAYRETPEFAEYQNKTKSIHRETALIHANLLRTHSDVTPRSAENRHDIHSEAAARDDADLEALAAAEAAVDEQEVEQDLDAPAATVDEEEVEQEQQGESAEEAQVEQEPMDAEDTRSGFESPLVAAIWRKSRS